MKKLLLLFLTVIAVSSCRVAKDDDYYGEMPMLKIVATQPNGRPLVGAWVTLYSSLYDYDHQLRPVREGWTNTRGEIIFDNLHGIVYYFDVVHEDYGLNNFNGVFNTRYALSYGKLTTIGVRTAPY